MASMNAKLTQLNKLRNKLYSTEHSLAKEIIDLLKQFTKENPKIDSIKWQQYTPHFNDGEPCVFSVYGPYIKFDESFHRDDEDSYDSGFIDAFNIDKDFFDSKRDVLNNAEIEDLRKSVKNALSLFDTLTTLEAALEKSFGNGVEVTITKDGVEVEDYDHD